MGFNTGLRSAMLKRYPEAKGQGAVKTSSHTGDVIVVDLLIYLFALYNTDGTQEFDNLTQLIDRLLNKVLYSYMRQGSYSVVILCIDNSKQVPIQKAAEQARRTASRKEQKYNDYTTLEWDGVHLGTPTGVSHQGQSINIARLLATRKMRERFWALLLKYMQYGVYAPPPGDYTIILDHYVGSSFCFSNKGYWTHPVPENVFGEADLKTPYWALQYASGHKPRSDGSRKHTIVVKTTDSDHTLTLLWLVHHRPKAMRGSNLILEYSHNDWIDIHKLYECMEEDVGLAQWLPTCVAGGTDFVDRGAVWAGVGPTALVDNLLPYQPKGEPLSAIGKDSEEGRILFQWMMRHVYACGFKMRKGGRGYDYSKPPSFGYLRSEGQRREEESKRKKAAQEERLAMRGVEKKESKRAPRAALAVPELDVIKTFYRQVFFNLKYWQHDWKPFEKRPPLVPRLQIMITPHIDVSKDGLLELVLRRGVKRQAPSPWRIDMVGGVNPFAVLEEKLARTESSQVVFDEEPLPAPEDAAETKEEEEEEEVQVLSSSSAIRQAVASSAAASSASAAVASSAAARERSMTESERRAEKKQQLEQANFFASKADLIRMEQGVEKVEERDLERERENARLYKERQKFMKLVMGDYEAVKDEPLEEIQKRKPMKRKQSPLGMQPKTSAKPKPLPKRKAQVKRRKLKRAYAIDASSSSSASDSESSYAPTEDDNDEEEVVPWQTKRRDKD